MREFLFLISLGVLLNFFFIEPACKRINKRIDLYLDKKDETKLKKEKEK